ncbi:thioredoxin [Weissella koreensis]|uniref:Thioredoxin n=1 Tax=Weissella koreensis TaxID=165096 RepID=A0A7H1MM32_9LACO|nr:thioredoxin [Weissella koreensis]AVH75314.1 thioredoxin [Weissella koreensis]EJF34812.1 thioredoxin [Weissella koreensis KCTC 3621]QGN20540.1 thioredoxin [Weissella koreensis]QNT64518.1 thioredoxin [Weissella koreensis]
MTVEVVNDQDFAQKTGQGVSLVDMWATWCGPCKMQSPVIEAVSEQHPEVYFAKMDVDENPATSEELGIQAIPTLLIKKDGEIVERLVGYHPIKQVNAVLAKYIDN